MKGIILAAGKGTRLYPMTKPVCKPLLPVYDKPLIYYPIAILMQAGISDILIIVPPDETDTFAALLGDGSQFGLHISYAEQSVARGIADALLIGSDFVGDDQVCLVLGDNIFYAPTLGATLKRAVRRAEGATVFGYWVEDPRPFGVVEFDDKGKAISKALRPGRAGDHRRESGVSPPGPASGGAPGAEFRLAGRRDGGQPAGGGDHRQAYPGHQRPLCGLSGGAGSV